MRSTTRRPAVLPGLAIGIDHPQDIDGPPSRLRTRWKDSFPGAAGAACELLARHASGVR